MSLNNVKKSIGWATCTINPVKGLCPMDCKDNQGKPYCYARKLYRRFHWDTEIRYEVGWEYGLPAKPARIFIGSTMELFGDWIKPVWRQDIIQIAGANPQHTFIFLTKQPQNLPREWPDNCYVGASATNEGQLLMAWHGLKGIKATIKFISFEPLLSPVIIGMETLTTAGIGWVILGQRTPSHRCTEPRIEWIAEIVDAADKAGVAVFLKNNMMPLLKDCIGIHAPYWRPTDPDNEWPYTRQVQLRQEFPQADKESK